MWWNFKGFKIQTVLNIRRDWFRSKESIYRNLRIQSSINKKQRVFGLSLGINDSADCRRTKTESIDIKVTYIEDYPYCWFENWFNWKLKRVTLVLNIFIRRRDDFTWQSRMIVGKFKDSRKASIKKRDSNPRPSDLCCKLRWAHGTVFHLACFNKNMWRFRRCQELLPSTTTGQSPERTAASSTTSTSPSSARAKSCTPVRPSASSWLNQQTWCQFH